MIEILTVICLYPLTFKDGGSKLTPLYGEMVDQKTYKVKDGRHTTMGWKINFSKALSDLGVIDYNVPVMYINENNCLVKERKEVNYEPE